MIALSGCSKWLDVKPEDEFIEEKVFMTRQGFYDALNGIYLNMASNNLYGSKLNLVTLDILAQTYHISTSHPALERNFISFNYGDKDVKTSIDNIWSSMYVNIANVNRLLKNVETYGHILDPETKMLIRGEALAARAYLYFDLLRMFAPAYTIEPEAERIPYYTTATYETAPFSKSSVVIENILNDLQEAESLLAKSDPAIQMAQVDRTIGSVEMEIKNFQEFRNYHLNYYAVKGLQARVYMYAGNKPEALNAAEVVIASKTKFPWVKQSDLATASTINRVFSMEVLFALENSRLYNVYDEKFNGALEDRNILSAGTTTRFTNLIFENWPNDYRFSSSWTASGGKSYPVFIKYKDITNTNFRNFRYTIPAIRLSEVFLIAAECEPDPVKGLAYLNELRVNRNCPVIGSEVGLTNNILKEYRKEFYGEGQLWYYYKRNDVRRVSGVTTVNKTINYSNYTFPIPLSETEPR